MASYSYSKMLYANGQAALRCFLTAHLRATYALLEGKFVRHLIVLS